jgi:hypothetical protein
MNTPRQSDACEFILPVSTLSSTKILLTKAIREYQFIVGAILKEDTLVT